PLPAPARRCVEQAAGFAGATAPTVTSPRATREEQAMPDPERYDERTALIVVDVQNDFADPAGGLYVRGGETIIERINSEIAAAQDAGAFVIYTQDWHPERTPHFQKEGGVWPVHSVKDTWGAELHPRLRVEGEVLRKGTGGEDGYSGFTVRDPETGAEAPTALERMLRERDIG